MDLSMWPKVAKWLRKEGRKAWLTAVSTCLLPFCYLCGTVTLPNSAQMSPNIATCAKIH